ncbi:uncharacterized protein LOC126966690 isoform X2 [Leptidea sinapis]|nr:uncharacterized protein LOC126966690 isoform X2 [Leptidea sinapis]XP_050666810.1 uncharacterized protein LOC126966690 isoform X2 [Leptidea sinapis]XP_050666811.1 uncharacterized protein LOC126966690 isoform X2 [Leptidea sinapis]XP_050666812.1 uncharacterized protein LOC126966690 isoform X2 [Leptidea sinapis]XP_050666813.1 uncharacterized protein LOC126966690 isoform X2 [Leptidea sinapis]XP_050666814.1 uncharacterized protein LOC126966690 isoform X2 [Leptidea sinapis]XP_050666815.1 uncharac
MSLESAGGVSQQMALSLRLVTHACYVLVHAYITLVRAFVLHFPAVITTKYVTEIQPLLDDLLFGESKRPKTGRELCLAAAVRLYLTIYNQYDTKIDIKDLIHRCMRHTTYEVVLEILDYLLVQRGAVEVDVVVKPILDKLDHNYIVDLEHVLSSQYLECHRKALHLLILENHQDTLILARSRSDVVQDLINLINTEHESVTHLYLLKLTKYLSNEDNLDLQVLLPAIRAILACSFSENDVDTRRVVVGFLEANFQRLLRTDRSGAKDDDRFEYTATLWSMLAILLQDDDAQIRQRISDLITSLYSTISEQQHYSVIPTKCTEYLLQCITLEHTRDETVELFTVLALLDFKSEVYMTDQINDECRVFDHSERHNVHAEDTVWTRACGAALAGAGHAPRLACGPALRALCGRHYVDYCRAASGDGCSVNPRVRILTSIVHEHTSQPTSTI